MMRTMSKTYNRLMLFEEFDERLQYLKLQIGVGERLLGHHRYIMQQFYKTAAWRQTRDIIIIRDRACDLGFEGYDIFDMVLVHHIDPITIKDVMNDHPKLYDPNNLICMTLRTHNYVHYGKTIYNDDIIERSANDMTPWRN